MTGAGGAGGSYEVSPSHAMAAAIASSQNASTVFIFGDKNTLDQLHDQTADARPTATASRGGAESQSFGDSPGGATNFNWPLLAVAGAAVLIVVMVSRNK